MAIYVRNKEGDLSPLNIPAIKGKDGINGVDGVVPNIEVGEITTIETGQEVTATIEGSKENPIIKFSIPKGIDGENGEEGNVTIDDNNISEESVWSPDKITGEIKKSNDKLKELKSKNEDQDNKLKEVERKNELQDFYINGLFNENSHNRMVIEEEGNEIKLEGSKKGFVEIDKIVGNTLVDRVNEPMKELTLNGDVDEKGFSVTTNESVENGLVDVVCEGNTLVNLHPTYTPTFHHNATDKSIFTVTASKNYIKVTSDSIGDSEYRYINFGRLNVHAFKPKTTYTLVFGKLKGINLVVFQRGDGTNDFGQARLVDDQRMVTITTKDTVIDDNQILYFCNTKPNECVKSVNMEVSDVIILEGDYTNKPIPTEYFEGIKSVGEQADGTHKIEILSNNKNLLNLNKYNRTIGEVSLKSSSTDNNVIIINGTYNNPNVSFADFYLHGRWDGSDPICTLRKGKSYSCLNNPIEGIEAYYISGTEAQKYNTGILSKDIPITGVMIRVHKNKTFDNIEIKLQIEESSINTSYTPHASNKKEISLKEPLRGLPNGVKDKLVKIDGKWFIERKLTQSNVLSSDNFVINKATPARTQFVSQKFFKDKDKNKPKKGDSSVVCNNLISKVSETEKGIWIYNGNTLVINSHLNTIEKLNKWLQENPTTIIYELADPIYEPLEITPELVCYDEVTHISNNSMISCNMVVKNTGFSCMSLLKDSSYTAVHNGDKGVTAKVDISDNMVRLHGKGKKVSDVTVVDGNISKLHYTFKGMKSSFEDKLVTQEMVEKGLEKAENLGEYRVDVKVRNKNLANPKYMKLDTFVDSKGNLVTDVGTTMFLNTPLTPNTSYYVSGNNVNRYAVACYDKDNQYLGIVNGTGNLINISNINIAYGHVKVSYYANNSSLVSNIQIEEGAVATPYEPYKEYNTSIYLTSPLLKGDEIVMREDGLYHYHKMGTHTVDPSFIYSVVTSNSSKYRWKLWGDKKIAMSEEILTINNQYPTTTAGGTWGHNGYKEGVCQNSAGHDLMLYLEKYNDGSDNSKRLLQKELTLNPLTIVYMLAEPYYEKISDNNILLDVPNNATLQLDSMLPCQNVKLNYTGKIPNLSVMKNNISIIEERNINTIANNFDMDFRLIELEQALKESKLNLTNTRRSNNISSNRFQQAKILILANRYNKEKMTYQLSKYLERGYLNQEEFDELIDLMN